MKLTILICGSFRQISSIYFITCFVFVAWFYTLVLVLHILLHTVISTCFFYCNFLLFYVIVTNTLIFRLCPNNILNTLVIYNSSWLPNCVSLIFHLWDFLQSPVLFFVSFPSLYFLSILTLHHPVNFFFFYFFLFCLLYFFLLFILSM